MEYYFGKGKLGIFSFGKDHIPRILKFGKDKILGIFELEVKCPT